MAAAVDAAARAALKLPSLITLRESDFLFQCTGVTVLDALDSLHMGSLL